MSSRSLLYGAGAVLAAIAFFAVGLGVAWLVFQPPRVSVTTAPPPSAPPADARMLEALYAQQRANKALEDQIAAARAKAADVCRPGDSKTGAAPVLGSPAAQQAAAAAPPGKGESVAASQREQLVALLENATVLVLAADQTGAGGHGTGFFIAPNLVLTNRHVVESAMNGGDVVVTSRALGRVHEATILALSNKTAVKDSDFGLLRVEGLAAGKMKVLALGPEPSSLSEVIAAGYPGVALRADSKFRALLQGDASATPEMVLTRGEVSALQNRDAQVPLVVHTAVISSGNSGGPLVDRCGRVVGINTGVGVDRRGTGNANFALASAAIGRFLTANGARPDVRTDACK